MDQVLAVTDWLLKTVLWLSVWAGALFLAGLFLAAAFRKVLRPSRPVTEGRRWD